MDRPDEIIRQFCQRERLETDDPYDIWKTACGLRVKSLFNRSRYQGLLPAAILTLLDTYLNNSRRFWYQQQEYPIVRAWASLCLLNLYLVSNNGEALRFSKHHLVWLTENYCKGFNGIGWGHNFTWPVSKDLTYPANTPLATVTPYVLEAFVRYTQVTGDRAFVPYIDGIYRFLEHDLKIIDDDGTYLVSSYAPTKDRRVVNAVSYTMYSYALVQPYLSSELGPYLQNKIERFYRYLVHTQNTDGSWYYSEDGQSFIDCFHSCIVLKNVIKTARLVSLPESVERTHRGYAFLRDRLCDSSTGLYRRFAVSNKPGLIKFDLYDNAEMLNLSLLIGDRAEYARLLARTCAMFCRADGIYSQIVAGNLVRNRNMLRWAVLPFLFAISSDLDRDCSVPER